MFGSHPARDKETGELLFNSRGSVSWNVQKMHTQNSSSIILMGMRIAWRAYTELCVIQLHVLLLPTALRLSTAFDLQS